MSAFTMMLSEALEYVEDIGLDTYPIDNEAHREVLNEKILNHYDAHEIGFETVNMFAFALRRRMNEIMPYYNQMYASELLLIDPLHNMSMQTTDSSTSGSEETNTGSADNTTNNTNKGKSVSYVMPQVALSGDRDYADSAADSNSDGTVDGQSSQSGNSVASSTNGSDSSTLGWQGSQADMLTVYRNSFLNIDMEIINSLSDLFLMIWNTSDSYTETQHPYYYGGF